MARTIDIAFPRALAAATIVALQPATAAAPVEGSVTLNGKAAPSAKAWRRNGTATAPF